MVVLLPFGSGNNIRFAELTEVIELSCTMINTYNKILNGIIEPIFPRYSKSIEEIKNRIIEFAESDDVLLFTGVLSYLKIL